MFCAINVTWPAAKLAGTAGSVGRAPRGAIPLIIWVIPMSLSVTVIGEPARAAGAEQTPREWWRVMWASTIGWPPRPAPDGWVHRAATGQQHNRSRRQGPPPGQGTDLFSTDSPISACKGVRPFRSVGCRARPVLCLGLALAPGLERNEHGEDGGAVGTDRNSTTATTCSCRTGDNPWKGTHVACTLSRRTPTSRCHCATAGRPERAPEWRLGADRAASGTRVARHCHPAPAELPHVQP